MEQLLGPAKFNLSNAEANFDCPFCSDSRQRFRMNSNTLKCYCFNCSWGGNAISFIQRYQRIKWAEALDIVNFYQDFRPIPQDVYEEVFDRLFLEDMEETLEEKKYIPLPSDFHYLHCSLSLQSKKFLEYAKKRGLTDAQIESHGVGWCPEGEVKLNEDRKTYLNRHIFIQTYDDLNKPLYWMARAIVADVKPKAFNPVGGVRTINKSDVLFNFNNAKKTGTIVLNEGVFDATTVGSSGVAMFGKTLSMKQLVQLIRAGVDTIYVMLDPDALEDAIKIANLLSKHIKNVFLCNLRDGDPNEVGRRGCLEALRNAERFNKLVALKYRLS
jgi:DNA primase